jgi:transposase-like protein
MARKYTETEKAAGLAALAANGGNVKRTARQIRIPPNTLKAWARGAASGAKDAEDIRTQEKEADRHQTPTLVEQAKVELSELLEGAARAMLAEALEPAKIKATPLPQLFVSIGIALDKLANLNDNSPISDEERVRAYPNTEQGATGTRRALVRAGCL